MDFPALTAHIFPSIIRTAMKGDDIAPFTEFFLACPRGHNTVCLFGFHKVKEAYLGNRKFTMDFHLHDLKPSVTVAMKNIYCCLHILRGGFWKREGFQSHSTSFSTAFQKIIYYTQEEKEENVKI